MLDKDTILVKKDSSNTSAEGQFLTCLKRAKHITDPDDDLNQCIDRILDAVEEYE